MSRALRIRFGLLCGLFVMHTSLAAAEQQTIPQLYNHEMHTGIFESIKFPCETCHVKDNYTWSGMNHLGCHECHRNPNDDAGALDECSRCHNPNVRMNPPRDHRGDWPANHQHAAKANGQLCATCHAIRVCVDCHQQRDTVRTTMHPRNFRWTHSIEARANPAKCDSCHQIAYCQNCHATRRIP